MFLYIFSHILGKIIRKYKEKRQPDAESKLPKCAECKISENCCRKICFLHTYLSFDETDKGWYIYTPNPASDAGKVNNGTGTYNKSDALLFFPLAGFGTNQLLSPNSIGLWSTTRNLSNNNYIKVMIFTTASGMINPMYFRSSGYFVRPVSD